MPSQMKCHYEVLNVERDASAEDLKKAYRKLALKWHPDKNPDNIDECTAQFRIVQQAYDVLTDPQERAWYDKHREAILRGGLGHGEHYEDNSLNVFQYFNTNCFSGYNDEEKGFYAVYKEVFRVIAEEDYTFMDDKEEDNEHPEFGDSQSSYEEVVASFYGFWESYCTAKSYVWVEKYDTREAPDRRCRRLMEAENKKLRNSAKKKRNEEVRELVKYIRKRDPRVKAYKKLLEERAEEITRKANENRERQMKERLKEMGEYKGNKWAATHESELAQLEANLAEHFGEEQYDEEVESGEDEDEEEYYDDLFCVACNKSFKSEKTFVNHEKSKKHKENVVFLREEMTADNAGIDGNELLGDDNISDEEEQENTSSIKLSKKQKKKRRQQQKAMAEVDTEDITEGTSPVTVEEEDNKAKQSNKSKKERRKEKELQEKMKNMTVEDNQPKNSDVNEESKQEGIVNGEQEDNRITDEVPVTNGVPNICDEQVKNKHQIQDKDLKCNVCSESFPTRNKLFGHIKQTGHALRVEDTSIDNKGKKNKKKGKR